MPPGAIRGHCWQSLCAVGTAVWGSFLGRPVGSEACIVDSAQRQDLGQDRKPALCSISLYKWNPAEFRIIINNTVLKAVSEFCLLGRPIVWINEKKKTNIEVKKNCTPLRGNCQNGTPRSKFCLAGPSSYIHCHSGLEDRYQALLPRFYLNKRECQARSNRPKHTLSTSKTTINGENSWETGIPPHYLRSVMPTMLAFVTYQDLC